MAGEPKTPEDNAAHLAEIAKWKRLSELAQRLKAIITELTDAALTNPQEFFRPDDEGDDELRAR